MRQSLPSQSFTWKSLQIGSKHSFRVIQQPFLNSCPGLAAGDIQGRTSSSSPGPQPSWGRQTRKQARIIWYELLRQTSGAQGSFWKENRALTGGLGEGLPSWPGLTSKEGLETAELSWLVQAASVTSKVLFYLPANSEIIAKNYSVLNASQALLSCLTLTFFTPHGSPICLPETCSAHPVTSLEKGRAGGHRQKAPVLPPSTTLNCLST